jgi:2-iminobutanoate/2-iminopropanoate deaminase
MVTNAVRIKTDPDPYEQFFISQAQRVGDLIFVSGQASIDLNGEIVAGDFEAQARQSIENLSKVLKAGGSNLDKLVKVTIYVTDISKFDVVMKLRQEYFSFPYPADTICEVKSLALPELQFEIEAVALAEGEILDA